MSRHRDHWPEVRALTDIESAANVSRGQTRTVSRDSAGREDRHLTPKQRSRMRKKRLEERLTFLSSVPSLEDEPHFQYSLDSAELNHRVE